MTIKVSLTNDWLNGTGGVRGVSPLIKDTKIFPVSQNGRDKEGRGGGGK